MPQNGPFDETPLIGAALASLRASVPPTWRIQIEPAQAPFDATVTIGSRQRAASFGVELKNSTKVSADQVINQLRAISATSTQPLMFITEYMNPPLRKACEELGFSYLDTTGWAYIVNDDPPLLIRLEGARKPPHPRASAPTGRLNGPAAGRTIRHLLELNPPIGIRQLATLSSASPAAVSKLMPTLVEAGAIDRSPDGTIIHIRRRTLLDRWTADYRFLNSNGVVLDYLAPRGLPWLLGKVDHSVDLCVTGSAAARQYLPEGSTAVIPLGVVAIYARDITGTADRLKLVRAERNTSNVIITTPRDATLVRNVTYSPSGFPIAPIGQVLADLLTLPGRISEEGEQLIDYLAENDPTWRE